MNIICFGGSNTCGCDPRSRPGVRFTDAGDRDSPMTYDGAHFTGQGYRPFAPGLLEVLQ